MCALAVAVLLPTLSCCALTHTFTKRWQHLGLNAQALDREHVHHVLDLVHAEWGASWKCILRCA